MLYQVYETQRTLMEPFIDFAQAAAKVFSQANTPLGQHPMAQRVAAGYRPAATAWARTTKSRLSTSTPWMSTA
jgi:poly-beta-hydroxyalkanoate depolymerase